MDESLRDVLSIAAERGSRATATQGASRTPAPLWAVAEAAAPKPTGVPDHEMQQLGRGGLRQAFWLCGFHEAMREREKKGESLTEREKSLLALSQNDFLTIRTAVIGLAMKHLDAVVHGLRVLPETDEPQPTATEMFTVETLRNLVVHGRQAMQHAGPDAALSLFGGGEHTIEPLAIFQMVFSAAIGLVETFERLTPGGSDVLARLSDALDAEVGRI
jgi:hypothetical protein